MRKTLIVSILSLFLIASCASLKPNPRPWTPSEKKCAVFFVLAHFADGYTTSQLVDNGNYERNPILDRYPSDSQVTIYFSLTGATALLLGHFWPELRKPLFISYGTLNTTLAIHNSRLD